MIDITWTDERKALAAAVVTIAAVSVVGTLLDVPFGIRTFTAVALGFVALVITSYLLTGQPIPPDPDEDPS